jgi:hypothetical protein
MRRRPLIALVAAIALVGIGGAFAQPEVTIHRELEFLDQLDADAATDLPPDPVIAEGLGYLVVVVNRTIAVYEFDGTSVTFVEDMDLDEFYGESGENLYDTRVVFDHYANTFVVASLREGNKRLFVAWGGLATGGDLLPLDEWPSIDAQAGGLAYSCGGESFIGYIEEHALGFDRTAWYVSSYLYLPVQEPKSVNLFFIIKKQDTTPTAIEIVSSAEFPGNQCLEGNSGSPPIGTETARPAIHAEQPVHDVQQLEDVPTPYFASVIRKNSDDACTSGLHNTLRIYSIADPLDENDRTLHVADLKTTDCFDAHLWYTFIPTSDTETSELTWSAKDARLTSVYYRKDGTREFLYMVHAVDDPQQGQDHRVVLRWYKIDLNGWPGDSAVAPSIAASGQIDVDDETPTHLFMPEVAVNEDQEMAVVYGRSNEDESVSLWAWGRLSDGNETPQKHIETSSSDEILHPPTNAKRLGDYYAIDVDEDGETFWLIGELFRLDNGTTIWTSYGGEIEIDNQ